MSVDGDSRVRRNAVYLFLGVIIANLASFLFRLVLAREFGPGGFGIFSLALMTTSIATMVALLGLPDGVMTFVSKFRERGAYDRVAGVILSSIVLSLGTAIILVGLVVLVAPFLANQVFSTPELAGVLWWFAWVIPANVIIDISAAYFLSTERAGYNTLIKQVIPKVSLLSFIVGIAVLDGPIITVGIAYLAATGIGAVAGVSAVGLSFPYDRVDQITIDVRELLTYSAPLLATAAIGFFLNWTDTMVVGYFIDSAAVGLYQSAFVLAANIHVILGAISGSLYPNFGSLFAKNDFETMRRRFTEGTRWAVLATTAPALYLVSFPSLSLGLLFGEPFAAGGLVLIILVIANGLIVLFGPSTNLLKTAEEPRYIAMTYGFASLLNIVLNVLLVPVAGIVGAAIGTSMAMVLANYFHFLRVRQYVEIALPVDPLSRALVAGFVALIPSVYIAQFVNSILRFGVHIAIFSTLYIAVLFAMGELNKKELRTLLSDIS